MAVDFIIGGARSGKSRLAESRALATGLPRVYLATAGAVAHDGEFAARIAAHRARRGAGWQTLEEQIDIAPLIAACPATEVMLVDCLTLWLANLMETGAGPEDIKVRVEALARACREPGAVVVAVTNEVGAGIVPENAQARLFRDVAGRANQALAAAADRVVVVIAQSAVPLWRGILRRLSRLRFVPEPAPG